MSGTPISRSADLQKLEAEGFRIRIIQKTATHLLIDGIPAVNSKREVVRGTLYCPLVLEPTGKAESPCSNHQCWWIGAEAPCDADGRVMKELISNDQAENKGDGITTTVGFSRKRGDKKDYPDYHQKIWTYVELIWHEARCIDPTCDPRSDKPVPAVVEAQRRIFCYPDMATTRAGIGAATERLLARRVAIIGLGGTGSYILDLLAKVPIEEIHLYDGDVLQVHNAFRAPGAPDEADFQEPKKVDWFGGIYGRMHIGLKRHSYHVTADNLSELAGFDFVFIAIDDADARKILITGLLALKVPLIDVGMDIDFDKNGALDGTVRITVATPDYHSHVEQVMSFAKTPDNGIYRNIQVADLNMLNAALAVNKWKRLRGFYVDEAREHHSTYTNASQALIKEDRS